MRGGHVVPVYSLKGEQNPSRGCLFYQLGTDNWPVFSRIQCAQRNRCLTRISSAPFASNTLVRKRTGWPTSVALTRSTALDLRSKMRTPPWLKIGSGTRASRREQQPMQTRKACCKRLRPYCRVENALGYCSESSSRALPETRTWQVGQSHFALAGFVQDVLARLESWICCWRSWIWDSQAADCCCAFDRSAGTTVLKKRTAVAAAPAKKLIATRFITANSRLVQDH